MRFSINDDCGFEKKAQKATDHLLALLTEHHDYSVPFQFVTKAQVIEIKSEPEVSIPIEIGILPVPQGRLTVDAIKRVVCMHFGISHNDLISPRRDHKVQRPRMVAMYLAREFTPHGLPALGRYFHRDHTSVLHSIRKMEFMVKLNDDPIVRDAQYLKEVLSA
jgi:chromosomal replication initiation ATPase DnaA